MVNLFGIATVSAKAVIVLCGRGSPVSMDFTVNDCIDERAQAAKSRAVKIAPLARAKVRAMTDAQKKALSLKMKEVWKKRKAEAAMRKG
jgi:hypothetical protein